MQEGSTTCILDHLFFKDFDVEGLKHGRLVPSFIPSPLTYHESISNLQPIKPYKGDQSVFADF